MLELLNLIDSPKTVMRRPGSDRISRRWFLTEPVGGCYTNAFKKVVEHCWTSKNARVFVTQIMREIYPSGAE